MGKSRTKQVGGLVCSSPYMLPWALLLLISVELILTDVECQLNAASYKPLVPCLKEIENQEKEEHLHVHKNIYAQNSVTRVYIYVYIQTYKIMTEKKQSAIIDRKILRFSSVCSYSLISLGLPSDCLLLSVWQNSEFLASLK